MSGARAGLPDLEGREAPLDLIGRVLGGSYRVIAPLDEGAMGAVFVAEHVRLHRQVAVKVLAQRSAAFPQALARFEQEAEAISRMAHPHIVQVLDFDRTEEGAPYLVMELLNGESLERRLGREPLDTDTAITVALQVASGLVAAHAAAIVHRDLKPGNIFLVAMPDLGPFAKLLDFGISKKLDGSRQLTGQFDVIGTPEYMSPEQASGATARVDPKGDQFSLAVIIYEMLSGAVPFTGDSVTEVLKKVINEPAPRLAARVDGLPSEVDDVLQRALEKDPARRFPDVAAFAVELARASRLSPGRSSVPFCRPASGSPSPAPTLLASAAAQDHDRPSGVASIEPRRAASDPSAVRDPATPPPFASPSAFILSRLSEARAALASGDVGLAWAHVETAHRAAAEEPNGPALLALIHEDSELASTLLGATLGHPRLGGAGRGQRERLIAVSMEKALNPKEAFLLSRFRDGDTLEQMLDLSPMPRNETLWVLANLAHRGVVRPP